MEHLVKLMVFVFLNCLLGLAFFWSNPPSIDPAKGGVSISTLEKVLIGGIK